MEASQNDNNYCKSEGRDFKIPVNDLTLIFHMELKIPAQVSIINLPYSKIFVCFMQHFTRHHFLFKVFSFFARFCCYTQFCVFDSSYIVQVNIMVRNVESASLCNTKLNGPQKKFS